MSESDERALRLIIGVNASAHEEISALADAAMLRPHNGCNVVRGLLVVNAAHACTVSPIGQTRKVLAFKVTRRAGSATMK